jgi:hypothetical protein
MPIANPATLDLGLGGGDRYEAVTRWQRCVLGVDTR